jgi:hypothetical protein
MNFMHNELAKRLCIRMSNRLYFLLVNVRNYIYTARQKPVVNQKHPDNHFNAKRNLRQPVYQTVEQCRDLCTLHQSSLSTHFIAFMS